MIEQNNKYVYTPIAAYSGFHLIQFVFKVYSHKGGQDFLISLQVIVSAETWGTSEKKLSNGKSEIKNQLSQP